MQVSSKRQVLDYKKTWSNLTVVSSRAIDKALIINTLNDIIYTRVQSNSFLTIYGNPDKLTSQRTPQN